MRTLLLGAGSIGRRHLANLKSLGVRDLAVYDPNRKSRNQISDEYQVVTVDSYPDALAWEPEIAFVCSPSHLHLSQARHLLAQNVHIFVEKPLSDWMEGVAEFIQATKGSRSIVQVGYNMRFHPAVQLIQKAVMNGDIGDPWVFRCRFGHYLPQWRPDQDYRETYSAHADQGGGVLADCIHEVDYLLWWGGEVNEVRSLLAHTSDLEIDTEDYATVLLKFTSGAVGEVRTDYLRFEKLREAEIIGSTGMLIWESRGKVPEHVTLRRFDRTDQTYITLYEDAGFDINKTYVDEIEHFLKCVAGEAEPLITAEEASRSLEVMVQARQGWTTPNQAIRVST